MAFLSLRLVVTIWTGVTLANKWENSRAYVGTIYFFPNVLGSILVNGA
jgi:ACS family allantoate permease-like MFS transporter